jgi:hypothetical protein
VKGCNDSPWDHRPGFVPGLGALDQKTGIRGKDAELVDEFQGPLNSAVAATKDAFGWTVVGAHVDHGRGHGYCSMDRWYNTFVDSYFTQGYQDTVLRPLGNFRIVAGGLKLHTEDGRALGPGDAVVWSKAAGCFVVYDPGQPAAASPPARSACVRRGDHPTHDEDPVFYELKREFAEGKEAEIAAPRIAKADLKNTSGPVHPNLFGHCNYAAALAMAIGRSPQAAGKLSDAFKSRTADADKPLDVDNICSPEAWGYELKP